MTERKDLASDDVAIRIRDMADLLRGIDVGGDPGRAGHDEATMADAATPDPLRVSGQT